MSNQDVQILSLAMMMCISFVTAIPFIVFPIWAAIYALQRGHNGWAIGTIVSIFLGFGPFVGLAAWLVARSGPTVSKIQPVYPASTSNSAGSYSGLSQSDDSDPYYGIPPWEDIRPQGQIQREKEREAEERARQEREEEEEAEWRDEQARIRQEEWDRAAAQEE